jgi:GDPmannose 4,6-dehydratase
MAKKKKALITGITGQDGSYLCELLLFLGYEVHGVVRPSSSFNRSRIEHILNDTTINGRLYLHYGDVADHFSMNSILSSVKPDEIYNLAAQSHVAISFQLPNYTSLVNGQAISGILEIVRSLKLDCKIYHACTSEMFGSTLPPQSIHSMFNPQSPYASAKLYSYNMCQNYREAYDLHVSCGILFNHESYRRGLNFVTKKIVNSLVSIKKGETVNLSLGNLNSARDWGWAPEYVLAMWQMLQIDEPLNLVVGTGEATNVLNFVEHCCKKLDLKSSEILSIDTNYFRPLEVDSLCADTSEMKEILGWIPEINWVNLANIMIEDEIKGSERKIHWDQLMETRNI